VLVAEAIPDICSEWRKKESTIHSTMSQGESDRSSADDGGGTVKLYPYLPPRIHEEKFQASVPSYNGNTSLVASESTLAALQTHSLQHHEGHPLQTYISIGGNNYHALKADARLMEYLEQMDFDMTKAKQMLEILHCGGKDLMNIKQYFSFVERTPIAACYNDLREKVQRTGGQPVSFFASHSGIQDLFRKETAKDRLVLGDQGASMTDGDYCFDEGYDAWARTQSRALSSEKQDARNRWLKIVQRLEKWHDGKARGILSNAMSIIEDASQIPLNFTVALHSSAGSSAQAQEDQEQIENLRSLIGDLLKRVVETQKWVAEARDILFRNTFTYDFHKILISKSYVRYSFSVLWVFRFFFVYTEAYWETWLTDAV
jgi:hypothetical protein